MVIKGYFHLPNMDIELKQKLITLADKYETEDFLPSDPSWFMHQVHDRRDQEVLAFIASCLSYGSRKQFFPKIQYILTQSQGNPYDWMASGEFRRSIPDNTSCYYRLYTNHTMRVFLETLKDLLEEYGTLGSFVKETSSGNGLYAINAITTYFSTKGIETIIPKNTNSACKRVCMFLRWMVRDGSPVDLGLWSEIIDKRTLIMPLDTHVMQEADRMGLPCGKSPSMSAAQRLTSAMLEVFPDDPLKGDFALFGLGVDSMR